MYYAGLSISVCVCVCVWQNVPQTALGVSKMPENTVS